MLLINIKLNFKSHIMKNSQVDRQFGDWREFVCGLSSAFINISVTFPLNKLIFRQIVHDVGVTGAIQQLSSEGFRHLYRGVLPPMCQKSISLSLMFGLYEGCRKPMIEAKVPPFLANPTASIIAGSTEAILTPFERIQTLLQDRNYNSKFHNMKHAFLIIGPQYGFKEYYRGLTPVLLRNGPSNALFFFMKDVAKIHVPELNTWWGHSFKEFVTGAVIGAFLSCVFYPCNVVKYHMQTRLGVPFQTLSEAFWDIYRERDFKFRKLYRGVQMNCTRAFISWGVINVAYEWSKKLIY